MAKKHSARVNTKAAQANGYSDEEWDIVPTGFAPIWKPEDEGDFVIFKPQAISKIDGKKTGNKKDSYLINGEFVAGTQGFFQKENRVIIKVGESVALGGATLFSSMDEKKLAFFDEEDMEAPRLSKLSEKLIQLKAPCKVVYKGTQKSSKKGHAPMKLYELSVPKGILEQI